MKKLLFLLTFLLALPVNAFGLPQGTEILVSPSQIKEYKILGQVGKTGEAGSYLYGIKKVLFGGYNPVTGYSARTSQYISATATTIPVNTTKDLAGNEIDLTLISTASVVKVYMTLDSGTPSQESVVCTAKSAGVNWSGCTRGMSFQGSSESASTSLQKAHNAGTPIIITNIGQFYNQFVSIDGTQTINGTTTFFTFPIVSSSGFTGLPTLNGQVTTKYYVDTVGAGGFTSANVSTTRGLSVDGSSPERVGINASSTTGMAFGPDGRLYQKTSSTLAVESDSDGIKINTTTLVNLIATSTPTGLKIPIANASGKLDDWVTSSTASSSFPFFPNTLPNENTWFTYPITMIPNATPGAAANSTNGWINMQAAVATADQSAKIGPIASTTLLGDDQNYRTVIMGTTTTYATFGASQKTRISFRMMVPKLIDGQGINIGFATGTPKLGGSPGAFGVASTTVGLARYVFNITGLGQGATPILASVTSNNSAVTRNQITGIDASLWHRYMIEFSAASVDFYVDGVLKFSHVTNFAITAAANEFVAFGFGYHTTGGADSGIINFTDPLVSQQF